MRLAGEDARQGFAPGITAPVEIVLERRGIGDELGALGDLQERAARASPASRPSSARRRSGARSATASR